MVNIWVDEKGRVCEMSEEKKLEILKKLHEVDTLLGEVIRDVPSMCNGSNFKFINTVKNNRFRIILVANALATGIDLYDVEEVNGFWYEAEYFENRKSFGKMFFSSSVDLEKFENEDEFLDAVVRRGELSAQQTGRIIKVAAKITKEEALKRYENGTEA